MEDGSRLKMCLFSDSQAPSAFTEKNLTFFGHFYDSCLQSIILPNMGKNEDIDFDHFRNYQVSRKNSSSGKVFQFKIDDRFPKNFEKVQASNCN